MTLHLILVIQCHVNTQLTFYSFVLTFFQFSYFEFHRFYELLRIHALAQNLSTKSEKKRSHVALSDWKIHTQEKRLVLDY